jgi:hypothetical protein
MVYHEFGIHDWALFCFCGVKAFFLKIECFFLFQIIFLVFLGRFNVLISNIIFFKLKKILF